MTFLIDVSSCSWCIPYEGIFKLGALVPVSVASFEGRDNMDVNMGSWRHS